MAKIKDLRLSDEVELAVNTVTWDDVLDEDNMATDSVNAVPTQQSVKAYADTKLSLGGGTLTNDLIVEGNVNCETFSIDSYERHVQIDAKADGSVANQPVQVDFFTAGGLQFGTAAPAKYAYCQWEIPDDWAGDDIYFEIDWMPDSGATSQPDAIKWDVEYRAIAEGELINQGTAKKITHTRNEDLAQYQTYHSRMTMPYNDANQPLAKQDHVYFRITRDYTVADDFPGSVTVLAYEIIYNSVGIPTSN